MTTFIIDYLDSNNRRRVEFISAQSHESAIRRFRIRHIGEEVVILHA